MDASPDPSNLLGLQLLLLFCLILINAFFAASEIAIVSVNKNKIKVLAQEGNKKAKLLLGLLDQPNKFLSTIQVAITLAGFLASASAATGMAGDIGEFLSKFGIPYGTQIAVIIVTVCLSFVTLVLGELYPKRIALIHSEKIALFSVKKIIFISKIAAPFVWLLSASVTSLLKLTKQHTVGFEDEFSEDEVMSMVEVGQETGFLKEEGAKMINSIFAFDDKLAYEVMTPRTDVFSIDVNDPEEKYIDELMQLRYSRIPVYENDTDNIIGILNIKDYLIEARKKGFNNVNIREILRKPYFVPESKNIDDLFRDLKASKQHIAILIDEYGGFSGIVTMEDLIEEIMGDIDDEYDKEEDEIIKLDENVYRVDGLISLDDLNEELDMDLESENSETLGGFLLELLGEIPEENGMGLPTIEFSNYTFKIEEVLDRRIEKVKLTINPKPEIEEEIDE
ncbi:MAG: HlyC/CorC family transporter [Clostridiales bacterium]|jgi:putative hemolysin|nr:HlyC/CorC family transporter [Clostridiales bacterium]